MGSEQRTIFIAFGCVALLIIGLIIYGIFVFVIQKRKYRLLEMEKMYSELNASEMQRNLIATELHNEIGPYLSSIKMRLDLIETHNTNELMSCLSALDKCIVQIRGMAKTLAPLSIFGISFQEAIQQYINEVNVSQDLKIKFTELEHVTLSSDQNNQIYRIVQEIILNTIKHAQAAELNIEISQEGNMLLIRTADNGIGFDMNKVRAQNKLGLGLVGIQSRIDLLNGTLSASDDISKGTRYNIRIPL